VYNGSTLSVKATYDDGSAVAATGYCCRLGTTKTTTIATVPLVAGTASYKVVLQVNTVYNLAVLPSNGMPLASVPFALPSILKVDPAALRSAAINLVFRRAEQTLAQVTPQVSFAFCRNGAPPISVSGNVQLR